MRNIAVGQLIKEANAPPDPTLVHYDSITDFIRRNPDCCAVGRVAQSEPLVWDVDLTILYRRQTSGPEPYFERTVRFGPCLENMEDSGRALTPELYRLFVTHRHGQLVK
jgi:hypothetical protein